MVSADLCVDPLLESMVLVARTAAVGATQTDLLASLVLSSDQTFGIRAAALVATSGTGDVSPIATYGESAHALLRLSGSTLWDESPVGDAIRSSSVLVISQADYQSRYAVPANDCLTFKTLIVVPIFRRAVIVGALALLLADEPTAMTDWFALGALFAPFIGDSPVAKDDRSGVDRRGMMTSRQLSILALMADGMTNRQIGRTLGYGTSTIGHDIMEIFQVLDVRNRVDAVKEAVRRGLVTRPG